MSSIKLYAVVFVALSALTTVQFALEEILLDELYGFTMAIILIISTVKAGAVAGWYMHLIDEPRAITYIAIAGMLGVVALTAGAAYSVT
jgi:cytochrome c oxidase subunit 4